MPEYIKPALPEPFAYYCPKTGKLMSPGDYAAGAHLSGPKRGFYEPVVFAVQMQAYADACVAAALAHIRAEQVEPVAWHNPRADKLRAALRDIADTKSLTATPAQFARHLQKVACDALTLDAMAEPQPVSGAADPAGLPAGETTGPVSAAPALTDAELLDLADDFRSKYVHGGVTFDEFDALGFARAVLAAAQAK